MTDPQQPASGTARQRVVMITGMSGAGLSTALKVMEDLGYEAVDNLPLSLVGTLVEQTGTTGSPVAVVVDSRNRAFNAEALEAVADALRRDPRRDVHLLFLDCADDVLQRRFTETRRRHPLAVDRPVSDGIQRERRMMARLRDDATLVLDTTGLAIPDFRRILQGHYRLDSQPGLFVFVQSFSFKLGLPRDADLVLDVRFLANPHWVPELRPLTGLNREVAAYVESDSGFAIFWERLTALLEPLLPRYAQEGKSYLTIAVGCTGGRHRSVYTAERIRAWLADQGFRTGLTHRDMERGGARKG
ncbi:MAG TPA: RNase adapter RapZ [Azospirillaceae bacterium]|nr:RNase adapter RapZ [Azospirillaceae bacterium]